MHTSFASMGLLTICFAVSAAFAETAVFKDGSPTPIVGGTYAGVEENMLVANFGLGGAGETTQNFGARVNFEVGEVVGNTALRHSVHRFDVSALAGQYATIDSITLRLYPISVQGSTGHAMQAFRMADANAQWIEGTGTTAVSNAPPDNGMSTWDAEIQGTSNWAGTPGASTAGVDYTSLLATTPFNGPNNGGALTPFDLEFNPLLVTGLIDDWTTGVNAGVLLRTAVELDNAITFNSSEASDASLHPELIVTYTVPEPAGLAAGLLGLTLLTRRRITARART